MACCVDKESCELSTGDAPHMAPRCRRRRRDGAFMGSSWGLGSKERPTGGLPGFRFRLRPVIVGGCIFLLTPARGFWSNVVSVAMNCKDDCGCSGHTDMGILLAYRHPATNVLVGDMGGEVQELLLSTCGDWVFTGTGVDGVVYNLGVLTPEVEEQNALVFPMSPSATCGGFDTDEGFQCFSGPRNSVPGTPLSVTLTPYIWLQGRTLDMFETTVVVEIRGQRASSNSEGGTLANPTDSVAVGAGVGGWEGEGEVNSSPSEDDLLFRDDTGFYDEVSSTSFPSSSGGGNGEDNDDDDDDRGDDGTPEGDDTVDDTMLGEGEGEGEGEAGLKMIEEDLSKVCTKHGFFAQPLTVDGQEQNDLHFLLELELPHSLSVPSSDLPIIDPPTVTAGNLACGWRVSPAPTALYTGVPTASPTSVPTSAPTGGPSAAPSWAPTPLGAMTLGPTVRQPGVIRGTRPPSSGTPAPTVSPELRPDPNDPNDPEGGDGFLPRGAVNYDESIGARGWAGVATVGLLTFLTFGPFLA